MSRCAGRAPVTPLAGVAGQLALAERLLRPPYLKKQ